MTYTNASREVLENLGVPLEGTPEEQLAEHAVHELLTTGRFTLETEDLTVEVSYE